jgi:hypothetical protein
VGNIGGVDCMGWSYTISNDANLEPYKNFIVLDLANNPNKINLSPPTTLLSTVSVSGQIYLKVWLTNYPSITKTITFPAKINNRPCEITWTPKSKPSIIMFVGDSPSQLTHTQISELPT